MSAVGRPVADQRDEHRERADDEGADDRHEAAEEGQHGERQRQRYAEHDQADADEHRVDEPDDGLALDEAAEHAPRSGVSTTSRWRPARRPDEGVSQGRNRGPSLRKKKVRTRARKKVTRQEPTAPTPVSTQEAMAEALPCSLSVAGRPRRRPGARRGSAAGR